jgi:hypothetical protein
MFDENTQNNTPTTDPVVDDSATPSLSSVTTDTPEDFPMISPAQGPASTSPSPSIIQTPHPTYLPSDSMSDDSVPAPVPTPTPVSDSNMSEAPVDQDLLTIKKNALQQLNPLVGHLEQTPEEKFKTMLMMIQASDDKSMLGAAYDTAQQITDEKVKAQALLDIVNEINYITHSTENQ